MSPSRRGTGGAASGAVRGRAWSQACRAAGPPSSSAQTVRHPPRGGVETRPAGYWRAVLRWVALGAALVLALAAVPARATQGPLFHPAVTSPTAAIATESPAAARVGRDVLAAGGNAVDAAAATVFALNVARPQSCGIGGGGFMVYRSHTGAVRSLDFRETAPAAIRPDQFVGNDKLYSAFTGHTTVGVPGVVAGMNAALTRYGTLSL